MPNFKITVVLAIAGLTLSTDAFSQDADEATQAEAAKIETGSTEGVVTNAASCEYEGGSVHGPDRRDDLLYPNPRRCCQYPGL